MRFHAQRAAIVTALAVLGVVPVVHAGDAADQPQRKHVSYADLNLHDSVDVAMLYRRIHQAAMDVCQPDGFGPALRVERLRARCVANAMATAVSKINDSALTAQFLARR